MTPREATIARLVERYHEARELLAVARAYQHRRIQRLRLRELDRAWSALYAVAGASWASYVHAHVVVHVRHRSHGRARTR